MEGTSTKSIHQYNARDLHNAFTRLYEQKFNQPYQVKSFIGYEMKGFKSLLSKYNVFEILCGIKKCIRVNSSTVTVHYVISSPKDYIPEANAEVQWMVSEYGTPEIKTKFRELLFTDSKWFPSATENKKQKELLEELKKWTYEKEKQKGWINKNSKN